MMQSENHKVILFYKFLDVENPEALREDQFLICNDLNLKGRMLIAKEGINATFEGVTDALEEYKSKMHADPRFKDVVFKESESDGKAFTNLKIKVRKEIVTLGAGEFDIKNETAKEMSADELHALYQKDEDFVVLDLRNDYEIQVGYFDKTINPKLQNFRDLNERLGELEDLKDKKVIAVCTGGIRCEKATCLLNRNGFKELYQLKDGIHTYMQKYPSSNFKGTLYVFDNRMTTPVLDDEKREVVGRCFSCNSPCEEVWSDDSVRPSKKVICCDTCAKTNLNLRSTAPQLS